MKFILALACVVLFSSAALAQSASMPAPQNANTDGSIAATTKKPRGAIFRATKDQIMQAQTMLKTRGHYSGEATGKLDPETRSALKKYQEAETLRITGTLNRVTLEKMGIELTERQRAMK